MKGFSKKITYRVPVVGRLRLERDNLYRDRGILQLEKGKLETKIRELSEQTDNVRNLFASLFIRGNGIEIGPSYLPVKLPKKVKVRYVDEASNEELIKRYPELAKLPLAPIHVIDNAEKLSKFNNQSLDFIIANHFIEHCQDPIGTVINMTKKLRSGGILYFAIPDKRYTFDVKRPVTPYMHLLDEHFRPTAEMKFKHFLEASEFLDHQTGKNIEPRAKQLMEIGYSIHYHVWAQPDLLEFFTKTIQDFKLPLEIQCLMANHKLSEAIFILKKSH
jgi:SAM-dependent methyltransferase